MKKKLNSDIVIYKPADGNIKFEVKLKEDTVWLAQSQIMKLFERDQSVISRHINNVF